MATIVASFGTLYTPLNAVRSLLVSDVFDFGANGTQGRTFTFQWGAGGDLAPSSAEWATQSSLDGTQFVTVDREVSLQGIKNIIVPGRYVRLQLVSLVGGLNPTFTAMMQT